MLDYSGIDLLSKNDRMGQCDNINVDELIGKFLLMIRVKTTIYDILVKLFIQTWIGLDQG